MDFNCPWNIKTMLFINQKTDKHPFCPLQIIKIHLKSYILIRGKPSLLIILGKTKNTIQTGM